MSEPIVESMPPAEPGITTTTTEAPTADAANEGDEEVTVEALPEGHIEERVQVDRRRLEQMITGVGQNPVDPLPNAAAFFESVERDSGARVHWPSRLKIGAKTKKDPFVKLVGEPETVRAARDLIIGLLRVKRDRITLKIEIPHSAHSHIIGRRGKNTQEIMHSTQCHIHFPDSNKHTETEKNNQVSVAGPATQVEAARSKLRKISPIILTLSAEVEGATLLEVQHRTPVPQKEVSIAVASLPNGHFQWTVKASEQNEVGLLTAVLKIREVTSVKSDAELFCRSNFELRSALLQNSYGLFGLNTIRWIADRTNTQMQFSPQGTCIVVLGAAANILQARRYLTGLLPVSIQFERSTEAPLDRFTLKSLEEEFDVQITEKSKTRALEQSFSASAIASNDAVFMIRTHEANLNNAYGVRLRILADDSAATPTRPHSMQFPPLGAGDLRFYASPMDSPKSPESPDPDESPIAHSLLIGVKSLNLKKGDLWRTPGLERQISRDRMLLKANLATYDPKSRERGDDRRQPTDQWSGYGFSNSLPAELFKKRMIDAEREKAEQPTTPLSPDDQLNSTIPNKGLASVREEEEFSDYNQSTSSNISSPLNRTLQNSAVYLPPHLNNAQKRAPAFATSATFFDTGICEMDWDIRTFADPSLVLAQLGCGEYLPQFREQEIDMQAFLLLDEQNLKDIGVSTMGARKKIYNAIVRTNLGIQLNNFPINTEISGKRGHCSQVSRCSSPSNRNNLMEFQDDTPKADFDLTNALFILLFISQIKAAFTAEETAMNFDWQRASLSPEEETSKSQTLYRIRPRQPRTPGRKQRSIADAVVETAQCEHVDLVDCDAYDTDELTCMITATGMPCCICSGRLKSLVLKTRRRDHWSVW